MRLSHTVFEILPLIFQKIKEVTRQRQFVIRRLGFAMINMHTKFEVSSLSRSRDISGGLKVKNGSHDVATPISGTVCHM